MPRLVWPANHPRMFRAALALLLTSVLTGCAASPAPHSSAPPSTPSGPVVARLSEEAVALRPMLQTPAARAFVDAVPMLPEPAAHTIQRAADRSRAYAQAEYAVLSEADRDGLTPRTYPPEFFYYTGYGSPLIYSRPLDIIADHAHWPSFRGKHILDFGYGSIGHLRLLAATGSHTTGIEVEPVLRALYSDPSATATPTGSVRLVHGRWPAEPETVEAVSRRAGHSPRGGFDLIISKNVLKRGYIHPARETDPRFLVNLGVDDATFLKSCHDVLSPRGWLLIYNISPAQNPPDKPYLPHADGQCPFTREQLTAAGFEIVAFDQPDTEAVLDIWMALGINDDKPREEVARDLFAWYTLCRRAR